MEYLDSFEEAIDDIKNQTPQIIYKFRDWRNSYHKRLLTSSEIWFAHPKTLNDPYDARPPYNFIAENIDFKLARIKMKEAGRELEPDLSEEELEREVESKMFEFEKDPIEYFTRNRSEFNSDESHYDRVGIFSCCSSFGNEAMWAHYGNNHSGFAVGFNTVELFRELQCGLGLVNYSDRPIDYYILGNNKGRIEAEILQKSTKWSFEEEIRFYTYGIAITRERSSIYSRKAIEEIIFGLHTTKEVVEEIRKIVNAEFPGLPLYKLILNPKGYGLLKSNI